MKPERLAAFTDGVTAVIITIMVLELKAPHGDTLADLTKLWPTFVSYVLSFSYVAIYWNNHHHLFVTLKHVTGGIMLANMNLLFWLSLLPFTTTWMTENHFAATPVALYGVSLAMPAVAYTILIHTIKCTHGVNSLLAQAIGKDLKGKVSLLGYFLGTFLAFIEPAASLLIFTLIAIMWFIPDLRIERIINQAVEKQ